MLPASKEARDKYEACLSAKRTALFEAAIASPESKPASEEIDLERFGMCYTTCE